MNEPQILTINPLMAETTTKPAHFERPALAADLAHTLVQGHGFLDLGSKGVLLTGVEGSGKTTFVREDVQSFLTEKGANAIPLYVSLSKNSTVTPSKAIKDVVARAASDNSNVFLRFKDRLTDAMKLKLGLKVKAGTDQLGGELELSAEAREKEAKRDCDMVREMLVELHRDTGKTVVMIIDGVENALSTAEGAMMLQAIKDAKETSNSEDRAAVGITNIYITSLAGNVDELTGPNEILERMPVRQLPPLDLKFIRHFFATQLNFVDPDQIPGDNMLRGCFNAVDRNARAFAEVMETALRTKEATSLGDALEMATTKYLEFEHSRITKALGTNPDPVELAVLTQLSLRDEYSPFLSDANLEAITFLHNAIISQETNLMGGETAKHAQVEKLSRAQVQDALSRLVKVGLVWASYNGMYLIENPRVQSWITSNALLQSFEPDLDAIRAQAKSLEDDPFWQSGDIIEVDAFPSERMQ